MQFVSNTNISGGIVDLRNIQAALKAAAIDGWLFFDFQNRDPLAYRILGLDFGKFTTRRWFYYLPAEGEPIRLAHKVESKKLDALPGKKQTYLGWKELHKELATILSGAKKVAMQYSPEASIPYVSIADAGTVDLVRKMGVEVVTSADLVQTFEAVIDEQGYRSHLAAGEKIQSIKDQAFLKIEQTVRAGQKLTEYELQQWILSRFDEEGLDCMGEHPIVGVNEHPADPHFEPTLENSRAFKKGDSVLIDLWAKLKQPGSIFYDITWCGFVGDNPPGKYVEIFETVRNARNEALSFVRRKFSSNQPCYGYEVDDACRAVINKAGYGEYFIHRTGHSIGENVHGNGVNIDNLETKDARQLVPGICFSIEPGIYLPGDMAARSEIDVFITRESEVVVAGKEQDSLILMKV